MPSATPDIFNFKGQEVKRPYTADRATLEWSDTATEVQFAINVQINYQQQINRRRVIGGAWAVRWGSQPQGSLTCQRILVHGDANIYKGKIWDQCQDAKELKVTLNDCDNQKGHIYICSGPVVSQLQITVEAESLTCLDNVVVEFLQLSLG
jgi:hypothetical protein